LVAEDSIDNLREQLISKSVDRVSIVATGFNEEQVNRIRALEAVRSADPVGWGILVLAEPRSNVTADVNDILVRGGARITSMTTMEPTLEDVFLDITGGEGDV
jgi:hypothetical protein